MPTVSRFLALAIAGLVGWAIGQSADRSKPSSLSTLTQNPSIGSVNTTVDSTRRTALVRAVEIAAPAVVGITVTSRQVVGTPSTGDPFFDLFFRGRPRVQQMRSWGSGVILDSSGLVATNHHVVKTALDPRTQPEVSVTLPDGRMFQAEVLGSDPDNDVAVLRIPAGGLPWARAAREAPLRGEWVLAIGNPFGYLIDDPQPSVSAGVVSATDRVFTPQSGVRLRHVIQTDAAINSGNSGGPLVNALGEVVGLNTFIFTGSAYERGNIGLGFAIPIARVASIVQEIVNHGRIRNFETGLTTDLVAARALGLGPGSGVLVAEVAPGSPGAQAGIRPGDVIVGADGRKVGSLEELRELLRIFRVGDRLRLNLRRDDRDLTVEMVLAEAGSD